ncbi:hypothetical protein ABB31_07775 [Stenotrophomonas pavanii]|nr:hypothetical protein ABB31_07775 [Stenotrophomonas pavanii]
MADDWRERRRGGVAIFKGLSRGQVRRMKAGIKRLTEARDVLKGPRRCPDCDILARVTTERDSLRDEALFFAKESF